MRTPFKYQRADTPGIVQGCMVCYPDSVPEMEDWCWLGGFWSPYHDMVGALAGPVAESMFREDLTLDEVLESSGAMDLALVRRLDAALTDDRAAGEYRVQMALSEAQYLLARPDVWLAVERVASNLLEHRQLDLKRVLTVTDCDWQLGRPAIWPFPRRSFCSYGRMSSSGAID